MIIKRAYKHLCDKGKCTGCHACANNCPKDAIRMKIDKDGAARPAIDTDKCVNCGMCDKICPVINEVTLHNPRKVYAAYTKENVRIQSASGGLATTIATAFISDGGIVYGASQTHGLTIEHIRVETLDNVEALQGSKYVQSNMGYVFKNISEDLKSNRKVLFIGTPCQVAAARKMFDENDLFYCLDLICHGVPTQRTLVECMCRESGCKSFGDKNITFRDADGFNIKIRNGNNEILYKGDLKNSYYYNGFIEGYIYRDNCYICRYAQEKRTGDITLGDFWGLDKKCLDGDLKKGINAVLVNSNKGYKLFNAVAGDLTYTERDLEEAVAGNGQLKHPARNSINHRTFAILVRYMPADIAVLLCNIKKTVKLYVRDAIRKKQLDKLVVKYLPQLQKKV